MAYDKPHKIQTTEESLHWISFNLKKIVEELKGINIALRETPSPDKQERASFVKDELPF